MRLPMARLTFLICALALTLAWPLASRAQSDSSATGAVYVMTNRAEGNSVLAFSRASNGTLQPAQEVATQGLGTGFTLDPLQSQGSLALSSDGKFLLAVNAGSGDVTAFLVSASGLTFGSKVASGGFFPVSVTSNGSVVYVLNQLGIANIAGFSIDQTGQMQPIPGSVQTWAGGALAQPAEVRFTPDGSRLLVTEKGTDQIDVFQVNADGSSTGPAVQASAGKTP